MKEYIKPIVIGWIAGILPYFCGYTIMDTRWWFLMPIFSLVIWFGIEVIKYIRQ